jgi:hypothetical protein
MSEPVFETLLSALKAFPAELAVYKNAFLLLKSYSYRYDSDSLALIMRKSGNIQSKAAAERAHM